MSSSLEIMALYATGGVGQVALLWLQGTEPCLPYLKLNAVQVWGSQTNDRSTATKLATVKGNAWVHTGLGTTAWYYWVAAEDNSAQVGSWYPLSAVAGVVGTPTKVQDDMLESGGFVLEPGSVDFEHFVSGIEPVAIVNGLPSPTGYTGSKVVFNIANGKLYRLVSGAWTTSMPTSDLTGSISAGQISASTLSAISANLGTVTAGTISSGVVVSASISADQINAGTLTGRTIRTASSGKRVEISATTNDVRCYDASGNILASLNISGSGSVSGNATSGVATSGAATTGTGISGLATTGTAVNGGVTSSGIGVRGTASTNTGVRGDATTGVAIFGIAGLSGIGLALYGEAAGAVRAKGTTFDFEATGAGANYLPFTGSHAGLIDKNFHPKQGDILGDLSIVLRSSISNALAIMGYGGAPIGVFVDRSPLEDYAPVPIRDMETEDTSMRGQLGAIKSEYQHLAEQYDSCTVNALGEGLINVCGESGDIAAGDLIVVSTTIPGKGMRQADDIIRAKTVAKARESVSFAQSGEVKQIACVYLCG